MKKRFALTLSVSVIFLITLAFIYWQYTQSPKHSLFQAKRAFEQHDIISFEKYVDLDGIISSITEQIFDSEIDANNEKDEWGQIGEFIGKGLIQILKPQINKIAKQQIIDLVETGIFEKQKVEGETKKSDFSFSDILKKTDEGENTLQGIEYVKKEGKICYVGLKFSDADSKNISILDLKMRNQGGYWQVAEIINFANFSKNSKLIDNIFATALKNNEILKSSETKDQENIKISPIKETINGKFLENTKAGSLFVITGRVKNVSTQVGGFVRITGKLFTKGGVLAKTKTVYCGNELSDIDLSNLDPADINKRLLNPYGDNKINAEIKPGNDISFMIVFSDLPPNLVNFTIEVNKSFSL